MIGRGTPGVRVPKAGLQTYRWPGNATNGSASATTPTPTNASAGAEVIQTRPGGPPVIVERGPRWLAELAFNPPGWLLPLIGVVAVVVIALAVLGAVRHGELDRKLQRELVQSGTTVVAAMIFAVGAQRFELSFWSVAVLAGGGGWLVALSVTRVADRVDGVGQG
jgi:hypothetical protein